MSILVPSNAGPLLEPNNRADVRFDGSTLKLLARASPATGPPTNGVVINTDGFVGIGTANPTIGRLHVVGDADIPAIYGESANRGVWGHSTGASRGVYGDSVSGEGVHGESTSGTGVAGVTASANIASPGVGGASTGNGGVGVRGDGTTGVYGKSTSAGGIGVTGDGDHGCLWQVDQHRRHRRDRRVEHGQRLRGVRHEHEPDGICGVRQEPVGWLRNGS